MLNQEIVDLLKRILVKLKVNNDLSPIRQQEISVEVALKYTNNTQGTKCKIEAGSQQSFVH